MLNSIVLFWISSELLWFSIGAFFSPLSGPDSAVRSMILDILRLLSGNPAKSRLLWWLFSWLSSRAFCKPGLWIWENALWPFLWPQSNPRRRVISLSLPKGKNQGPGKLPRISQTQMLARGRLLCSGLMPSPPFDVPWLPWEGLLASSTPSSVDFVVFPRKEEGPFQRTIYR